MRNNQPVTQREEPVRGDAHLITTTNLRGKITFVNDDFARIAGFEKEELVGQPHNIIRHPDMPPGAFEDLWNTIKSGRSWKGVVKNRCKNGDHYWVDAYVTPIQRDGETIEFQSVRVAPSREQIARAEKVYSQWRSGSLPAFLRRPRIGMRGWMSLILLLPFLLIAWEFHIETLGELAMVGSGYAAALVLSNLLLTPLARTARRQQSSRVMTWIYTGRQDEVGQLEYARMLTASELRAVAARMTDSSEKLQTHREITENHSNRAIEGLTDQKDRLTENAAAIEELSQTVTEVAGRTQQTSEAASRSVERSESGRDLVERMTSSIQALAERLDGARQKIDQLAERSREIGSVIDVINEVAEQTNLLALNAAIEAARAGEAGRGFAVVADEVRGLAGRTHQSTSQISEIITGLQEDTAQAVDAVQSGVTTVGESVELAEEVRGHLHQVIDEVQRIAEHMTDVASATEQQSTVTSQLAQQTQGISDLAESSVSAGTTVQHEMADLARAVESVAVLALHFLTSSTREKLSESNRPVS